ncbi:MAG: SH3 domain-containing protein [Bdellovibrionales bacterium]
MSYATFLGVVASMMLIGSYPAWAGSTRAVVSAGSSCLNFRTRPGGTILDCLDSDTEVEVLDSRPGSYTKVRVGSTVGYLWSRYLRRVESLPATDGQSARTVSVDNGCLRLRTGPSLRYRSRECLRDGTELEVTGPARGDYLPVRVGDQSGYVASRYLRESRPSTGGEEEFTGPARPGAPEPPPRQPPPLTGGPILGSTVSCENRRSTFITHYGANPATYASAAEARMEGGSKDRYGLPLTSVEESIRNGRPVSLAADHTGSFGRECNRKGNPCLMLVCYSQFDRLYPSYRRKFPGVPANCLIGVIVDTGGAFGGSNGRKIDVAVQNRRVYQSVSGSGSYTKISTPTCEGSVSKKRVCDVSSLRVACGERSSTTRRISGLPATSVRRSSAGVR